MPFFSKVRDAADTRGARTDLVPTGIPAGLDIVVADDDAEQLRELAEFLTFRGHRVFTAGDGVTALAQIASHRPQIAMIDVNMPGCDGIRVARDAATLGHHFSLIFISGDSEATVRANQAHATPFAVIEKPVPLRHLERFIDAISGERTG